MAKFSKEHPRYLKIWPEAASQKALDAENFEGFTLSREQSFPETPWLSSAKQPGGACSWPATAPHHVRNGPVEIQDPSEVVWGHFKGIASLACPEVLEGLIFLWSTCLLVVAIPQGEQ